MWWRLVFIAALSVGCSGVGSYVWASQLPAPPPLTSIPIEAGDRVQVLVFGQDQLSAEVEVRPGGDIVLPVVGKVQAAGNSADLLATKLAERLRGTLEQPRVNVVVTTRRAIGVGVLGEVKTPGRYDVKQGEGVLDALARAGGLTPFADSSRIFVVRRTQNPRVRFRYADLTAADPSSLRFRLMDGDVVVVE